MKERFLITARAPAGKGGRVRVPGDIVSPHTGANRLIGIGRSGFTAMDVVEISILYRTHSI
ncbi:MAG: hypothetical protein ACLU4W_00135 [Acutalibacteraceae bacterium]